MRRRRWRRASDRQALALPGSGDGGAEPDQGQGEERAADRRDRDAAGRDAAACTDVCCSDACRLVLGDRRLTPRPGRAGPVARRGFSLIAHLGASTEYGLGRAWLAPGFGVWAW